jgi:hypothetical protein
MPAQSIASKEDILLILALLLGPTQALPSIPLTSLSPPSFIIMSLVEDKGTIYTYTYKSETEEPSFTSQEITKPK